jgi:hypothetical protein
MSELPNFKATYIVTTHLTEKESDLMEIRGLFGEYSLKADSSYAQTILVNRWTKKIISSEKFSQENQQITFNGQALTLPVSRFNQVQELCSESLVEPILSETELIRQRHPLTKQIILGLSMDNNLHTVAIKNDIAAIIHFTRNKNPEQETIKGRSTGQGIAAGYLKHISKKSDLYHIRPNTILVGSRTLLKNIVNPHINALVLLKDKHVQEHHLQFRGPRIEVDASRIKNIPEGCFVSVNAKTSELTVIGKVKTTSLTKKVEQGKVNFFTDISSGKNDVSSHGYSLLNATELVKSVLRNHKTGSYTDALINYLLTELRISPNKPLLYQSVCVSSDNKIFLGKQGAQYIRENPDFFIEELEALHRLLHIYNFKDITLTIPFVRTVKELEDIKQIISRYKLTRSHKFKLFITIQVPANILQLEEYLDLGVDGIILDLQCLTDLTLGVDSHLFKKNYKKVEHTYEFMDNTFRALGGAGVCEVRALISKDTKLDPSILKLVQHCEEIAKKRHTPLYIYIADDYEETRESELSTQSLRYVHL